MKSDIAFENFKKLKKEIENKNFNEADTRAKIIDKILVNCLSWTEDNIKREDHVKSGYIDYKLVINNICTLVIEAKKSGSYFEIPKNKISRSYKISSSISTVKQLKDAMNQVRNYCNDIGCKYAVVFNGHQIVIFPAISIGKPWTEGYCIVFHSLLDIEQNFNYFWNILSAENIIEGSLIKFLDKGNRNLSFEKLRSEIHNPDQIYTRNELFTYIRPISDEYFSELLNEKSYEALKECYVFERSNRKLKDELDEYFIDKLPYFTDKYKIKDIFEREARAGVFEKEYIEKMRINLKGSLIVLLGGIGSGKSTFLYRFFKIILEDKETLLWFYLDFRICPPDKSGIKDFFYKEIINQWEKNYEKKITPILEKVGFNITKENKEDFLSKLFALLNIIKFSTTIIIDNVDQHNLNFQENLFLYSNHLAATLKTITIVALREETFILSTRSGVFDAYYIPKYHIAAPNFLDMIKKRIEFTIKLLSSNGDRNLIKIKDKNIREDIIKFFKIVEFSLSKRNVQSNKIINFIEKIAIGNMREALLMFNNFLVSGNTNINEMFERRDQSTLYQISYHQIIKSIILGEYKYYSQNRSHLMNLFDFDPYLTDSHFNLLRILKYLKERRNTKSKIGRGYIDINDLLLIGEEVSIRREVIIDSLLRLSRYNLVEYDNQSKNDIENASYVKITHGGGYYIDYLIFEFIYLDSIYIDTLISDTSVIRQLKYLLSKKDLQSRIDRVQRFISYLVKSQNDEIKDYPQFNCHSFTEFKFASEINKKFYIFKEELKNRNLLNKNEDNQI